MRDHGIDFDRFFEIFDPQEKSKIGLKTLTQGRSVRRSSRVIYPSHSKFSIAHTDRQFRSRCPLLPVQSGDSGATHRPCVMSCAIAIPHNVFTPDEERSKRQRTLTVPKKPRAVLTLTRQKFQLFLPRTTITASHMCLLGPLGSRARFLSRSKTISSLGGRSPPVTHERTHRVRSEREEFCSRVRSRERVRDGNKPILHGQPRMGSCLAKRGYSTVCREGSILVAMVMRQRGRGGERRRR